MSPGAPPVPQRGSEVTRLYVSVNMVRATSQPEWRTQRSVRDEPAGAIPQSTLRNMAHFMCYISTNVTGAARRHAMDETQSEEQR